MQEGTYIRLPKEARKEINKIIKDIKEKDSLSLIKTKSDLIRRFVIDGIKNYWNN